MLKEWRYCELDNGSASALAKELGIGGLLARVLAVRGMSDPKAARAHVEASLDDLYEPLRLPDMEKAVSRIWQAIRKQETIFIFGDYDVDGITSCALLESGLKELGAKKVIHYLPHRLQEGYGLNLKAVRHAAEIGARLVITVDCGINAFKEITELNRLGLEVIITDHHQPDAGKLPAALAVIDPKRQDASYPYRELAGVGLVFKLLQALRQKFCREELDLVCLGTIADAAPLDGENRVLVKEGLKELSQSRRPGIQALFEATDLKTHLVSPTYVSFILGPRLNATGRLGSAEVALELIMSDSKEQALSLALQLNEHNRTRQKIEEGILQEALAKLEQEVNFKEHSIIVLSHEGWHRGVLGIVASRIAERFYRPTIIISVGEEVGRASARSIDSFHLYEALNRCQGYLEGFGGHRLAAGFTIQKDNIQAFRQAINTVAKELLSPSDLIPSLCIDAACDLGELNAESIAELDLLSPFGSGNPPPLFLTRGLWLKGRPAVLGRNTLKVWVTDGRLTYPALGFDMAGCVGQINDTSCLDLVYTPVLDNWQGYQTITLQIRDIRSQD